MTRNLEAGHILTLVSAPAGFGKTTLVSEWLNTVPRPVTWHSLDRADDDLGRFFNCLTAALQKMTGMDFTAGAPQIYLLAAAGLLLLTAYWRGRQVRV